MEQRPIFVQWLEKNGKSRRKQWDKKCLKQRLLPHTSEDVIKSSAVDFLGNASLTPVLKPPLCLEE